MREAFGARRRLRRYALHVRLPATRRGLVLVREWTPTALVKTENVSHTSVFVPVRGVTRVAHG